MAVGTVVAEVGRLPSSHGSVMRGFRDVPRRIRLDWSVALWTLCRR